MGYNKNVINFARNLCEELTKLNFRLYQVEDEDKARERDEYMRDYARVLYSSSFRRLQGKMQLLGIDSAHFHRNRLTHSLEVAQIARGIAFELDLDTTTVVETASLAHDMGNSPFGHHGEKVLSQLADNIGGFEGNAQTLRILMRLEKKDYRFQGLNLTFRTLMGVTKYYALTTDGLDKFIYDEDYAVLSEKIAAHKLAHAKTIDCQIMDLADEIAYAAHDLEDTLSFGYLAIDELLYEFKINEKYSSAYDQLKEIVKACQQFAFKGNTFHTSEEYSFLFRKELTSKIVNILIRDIDVIRDKTDKECLGFKSYAVMAKGLKKLLFSALLRKSSVQLYEKKGERVLRGLFDVYMDEKFNRGSLLLPPEYRGTGDEKARRRLVIDYIAGMMDSFAMREYEKYYGKGSLESYYSKSTL